MAETARAAQKMPRVKKKNARRISFGTQYTLTSGSPFAFFSEDLAPSPPRQHHHQHKDENRRQCQRRVQHQPPHPRQPPANQNRPSSPVLNAYLLLMLQL